MSVAEDIEAVARAAVYAGGAELHRRYRAGDDEGTYTRYDVKAAADEAAETRMLPVIRRAFPDHPLVAEEAGAFAGTATRLSAQFASRSQMRRIWSDETAAFGTTGRR